MATPGRDAAAFAIASDSRTRSATSADSAATGSGARHVARQADASSIQVGISCCRIMSALTGLHRAQAPVARSITSWTRTSCPAHGCQA
jgi:hypothetical protein